MVKAGHISGRFSYQGIMEAAFGKAGYVLLGALQFFYPFIGKRGRYRPQLLVRNLIPAMVSYNVVVGDTVTKVIVRLTDIGPQHLFAKREIIVLIATIFITVPLCLYRDIAKLAKISFFSLVCIGFILFSIMLRIGPLSEVVYVFWRSNILYWLKKIIFSPQHPHSWRFFNTDIIPAIGIMAFGKSLFCWLPCIYFKY